MPLAPIIIVAEIFLLIITHQFNKKFYKIPFLIIIINRILEKVLKLSITIFFIALFKDYALFHLSLKWYFIPLGYLIYELNSFIRHYAHKIRLLWCSHAVHHSATEITSSVTLTTAYLENIYTDIFAASFCTLMGLSPSLFFFVMILDSIWGAFVHVSEKALKNGRLGFLEKLILTPSHHRVHHASNDLYMDTNFCSIINIWDRLFGTYQEEKTYEPVKYGITRPMDANNFWDVYFGEYVALWNDVKNAKVLIKSNTSLCLQDGILMANNKPRHIATKSNKSRIKIKPPCHREDIEALFLFMLFIISSDLQIGILLPTKNE
jgi:sterol desaturase/sphingolipid hydroxylase (fatty acid hydroxylase superfamily)